MTEWFGFFKTLVRKTPSNSKTCRNISARAEEGYDFMSLTELNNKNGAQSVKM
jgi:hypothetical protein